MKIWRVLFVFAWIAFLTDAVLSAPPLDATRGDRMIAAYFEAETAKLAGAGLSGVKTLDDWNARRETLRKQLLDMLGLDPMPERTDLAAKIAGQTERDGIVVERLHYQSRPHLYVTANLYRPAKVDKPLPAILYVCGHGPVKIDGVSYGNKVSYQHHGAWFARHGYVCLTIDTVQLGEIPGIHHGTYREGMWWWLNRGYTPAGVEAWNCVRALDYLQSRKEVDPQRIGVTGRSGGGAYSWWIAAIDDRIKAAVPVAGITDLQNHVVDGCVEGHCDCMYMVNTYRWDYPTVAALVHPRPLMISNSDRDGIFPLDGVVRTYYPVRRLYELAKKPDDCALNIVPGPHKDNQDLQVPAFRWFNKHLKGDAQTLIEEAAVKRFEPQELRVFQELPKDQINSKIHETFVPAAPEPKLPATAEEWKSLRDGWLAALKSKSFAAWPESPEPLATSEAFCAERDGLRLRAVDFTSQGAIRLRLYVLDASAAKRPERIELRILDDAGWQRFLAAMRPAFEEPLREETLPDADAKSLAELRKQVEQGKCAVAFLAPRGVGPTAWNQTEKKQTQIRRRFMLLGQTLDGMQVWDVRRGVQAVRELAGSQSVELSLSARGPMAGVALYASLFEPNVGELVLSELPPTHRNGPIFLNVSRILEMPQAAALAADRSRLKLLGVSPADWQYVRAVGENLGWKAERFVVER